MAVQLRLDASWMYCHSSYVITPVTPVESDGKEDIRSLGPAVANEGFIRRPHKVGIFKVDVGEAAPGRGEVDQTPSLTDKWRDTVDEHEVPQMIDAELHFKAVRRMTKRRGYHSGISDDHVEGFTLCEECISAASNALKIGEIQRNQLEAANIERTLLQHLAVAVLTLAKFLAAPTT